MDAVQLLQPIETALDDQIVAGVQHGAWSGRQVAPIFAKDGQDAEAQCGSQPTGGQGAALKSRTFPNFH